MPPGSSGLMAPSFGASIAARSLAAMLRTAEVQQIQFRLGYLRRTSAEWTRLADALLMGHVTVDVNPTLVRAANPNAVGMYQISEDRIVLASNTVLSTAVARSTILHECSHAIRDLRGGGTDAIRHDEATAFICEAMYHQALGATSAPGVPTELFDIAAALRARGPERDGVPHATRSEIIAARQAVGRISSHYSNHHYYYDGVQGV